MNEIVKMAVHGTEVRGWKREAAPTDMAFSTWFNDPFVEAKPCWEQPQAKIRPQVAR